MTEKYSMFLQQCKSTIGDCVPFKTVSLGRRDPDFITPLIKSLLKTGNKYRHSGRIQQANMLSNKINRLIAEERSRSLARLDRAGPKKLWAAVRKNNVSNNRDSVHSLLADPNAVNHFFASVSYDSSYKKILCDQLFKNTDCEISVELSEMERC